MLLGISIGLFCVLILPWLGLHCGASTLTWLFVAPLFSFPKSGFSPQSIPLSAFAYSVKFNFKGKKKNKSLDICSLNPSFFPPKLPMESSFLFPLSPDLEEESWIPSPTPVRLPHHCTHLYHM